MFLKVILYFRVFSFWSKCIFVFFFKNWFRGCFARSSRLRASHEMCLGEIKSHIFIQIALLLPHKYFATKLFSWNVFRQKLENFHFIPRLLRLSHDCFATKCFSRKPQCVSWLISRLSNPRKTRVFSFYVANVTCFQTLLTSLTLPLSNPPST